MENKKAINFDMDGTIANFYACENWRECLNNFDSTPYAIAKPLVNFSVLARLIHKAQRNGYAVNIISWLSMTSTAEFDAEVTAVKKAWLAKHLPSVEFDEVHIVAYGTPKSTCGSGYLFDDEERNRNEWGEGAFTAENLIETLKSII